jgi:hypothetical protein
MIQETLKKERSAILPPPAYNRCRDVMAEGVSSERAVDAIFDSKMRRQL